jgi:hypothetical protein
VASAGAITIARILMAATSSADMPNCLYNRF